MLASAAGVLGAQEIDRTSVHLSEQEGAQRSARGVVPLGFAPRADEDLLDDLLGEHAVAEHAPGQAEGPGRVPPVQLGERAVVTIDDRSGEHPVVGVVQGAIRKARPIRTGSHTASSTRVDPPDDLGRRFAGMASMPEELRAWITAEHAAAPEGWEPDPPLGSLRCHPDLVERVAALVRPLRPRRAFVGGCPVIHHPAGQPFAAAWGTSALVARLDERPALILATPETIGLDRAWVDLDPWPVDVAFARGTDLLRQALARAYDRASI